MTGKTRRRAWARARTVRLARLFIGPNRLRRPCDRVEGLLVMLLAVAFLVAVAAAPSFCVRLYQSQRANVAQLHPATAVLTQSGPSESSVTTVGEAAAAGGRQMASSERVCSPRWPRPAFPARRPGFASRCGSATPANQGPRP